jgi:plasmid stabilization system protein ParE
MRSKFHPEAQRELRGGADYFNERSDDAGAKFVRAVRASVQRALATPHAGARWPGVPADFLIRRRRVQGFKYISVAYAVLDEVLWVLAIVHDRRRPGYWLTRLRDLPKK